MSINLVQNISQIGGYGFPLNDQGSFMLSHLTKGDFNAILGRWIPAFPSLLTPKLPNGIFTQGFPLLQLVQNLQTSTGGVLDKVMQQVGGDMNLRSGFLNTLPVSKLINELGHGSGVTLDIGIQGFATNPALIAEDIKDMLKKNITSMDMVFNTNTNDGYFHINIDKKAILGGSAYSTDDVIIRTVNMANGEVASNEFAFMNGYS